MMDSSNTVPRPICRARKRQGRCYELAGAALLNSPSQTSWRLVHGTARGTPGIGGHAWLTDGESVWDPLLNRRLIWAEYRAAFEATPSTTYTRAQMCELLCQHNQWGPG
jgi:hypothetical protein